MNRIPILYLNSEKNKYTKCFLSEITYIWKSLQVWNIKENNLAIINKGLILPSFKKQRAVSGVKGHCLPVPGVVVITPTRGLCITDMFGYIKKEESVKVQM